MPAALLQNGTYVLQLGPKRLAAMRPGNRQTVVRWMRDVRKRSPPPLSPYLQKAAVYSDEAGSEIIMAIDLEGAMWWERVCDYLTKHKKSLREWQGKGQSSISLTVAARVVSSVRGIRIGVRIGQQPTARIAVDLSDEAYLLAGIAKPLLLQILSDNGALINDFQSWTVQAAGSEISLSGKLSSKGLRELLSVVDSPVGDEVSAAAEPDASPGQSQATQAEKSRRYFRTIVGMADDLKDDMKKAANLASTQLFFERYAKRIERMPILGIDEDLLKYSAYVANGSANRRWQSRRWESSRAFDRLQSFHPGTTTTTMARLLAMSGGSSAHRRRPSQPPTSSRFVRRSSQPPTTLRRKMTLKYQVEF